MQKTKDFLQLIRIKHWIKNLFIFAPLVFAGHLLIWSDLLQVIWAFFIFSFATSAMYVVNDLFDLKEDRQHPIKKYRPLPSGKIGKKDAVLTALLLAIISLGLAFVLKPIFSVVIASYLVLFFLYSWKLKHLVIIDVLSVALGFVLRVIAGALVIMVPVSHWLILCTLLIALFISFGKRRHELILLGVGSQKHRRALSEYSPTFLDQMILVTAAATVVSYALYTIDKETIARFGTDDLIYTVPFVLYGLFRYFYLVYQKAQGGNPTRLVATDPGILIDVFLWSVSVFFIIYLI